MVSWIPVIGGAVFALAAAQTYVLGSMGGIGPLGFLRRNKIAKHPGNSGDYDFERIQEMPDTPLKGKNICILGSSVFYGAASNGAAVGEYLARRHACTITKSAVGGTTLSDISPNSYVSRMKKLDPTVKYDLFLVQLSTNDATRGLPLGEIGTDNEKTVTGAIESILRYVRDTWNCPVVFLVGSRYKSKGSARYAEMRQRLLELQSRYLELSVIDLWQDDFFNDIEDQQRSLYMLDGIHPTKAGYRDWWGPEIDRQLCAAWKVQK